MHLSSSTLSQTQQIAGTHYGRLAGECGRDSYLQGLVRHGYLLGQAGLALRKFREAVNVIKRIQGVNEAY